MALEDVNRDKPFFSLARDKRISLFDGSPAISLTVFAPADIVLQIGGSSEVWIMLIEYIEEALKKARYEIIDNPEPYYGEIPKLKGVWATGKSLEECRRNLAEVVEGWIIVRLRKGLRIPPLGRIRLRPAAPMKSHA